MAQSIRFSKWLATALLIALPLLISQNSLAADEPKEKLAPGEAERLLKEAVAANMALVKCITERKYAEAETWGRKAVELRRKVLGDNHLDVAGSLNNLAYVYWLQTRLKEAEPLFQQSLKILEARFGPDHLEVAQGLINLAGLYSQMGRFPEAEQLFQRGLKIQEAKLGPDQVEVARTLASLAEQHIRMGRLPEAERLMLRCLKIQERKLANDDLTLSESLNTLARIYMELGRHQAAEPLFRRSLEIVEAKAGKESLRAAYGLNSLALLYRTMGRLQDAMPLLQRSLDIRIARLGQNHPEVTRALYHLAQLYQELGRLQDAEPLVQRGLQIDEIHFGNDHVRLAEGLNNLGSIYLGLGRFNDAEKLLLRALKIRETQLFTPADQRNFAYILNNVAQAYDHTGRPQEAAQLYERGLKILEKHFGPDHPSLAPLLINLAALYDLSDRFAKAQPLFLRALRISETSFGQNHPNVALSLHNLAGTYKDLGRFDEAEKLWKRSLQIWQDTFGADHPHVAKCQRGLAVLAHLKGDTRAGLKLFEHSMAIDQANLQNILAISSERDMFAHLETINASLWSLITLAGAEDKNGTRAALDWSLRRKSIVFDTLFRFRQAQALLPPSDPLAAKLGRYRFLQQLLADTTLNPPKDLGVEALAKQKERWQTEANGLQAELNRRLAQKYPEHFGVSAPVDTAKIQRALPAGSALIEFVHFRPNNFHAPRHTAPWLPARYCAFILSAGNDAPKMIDLGPADVIDKAVAALRAQFEAGQGLDPDTEEAAEAEYRTAARALYKLVFAPLQADLAKAKLLYLATDGELSRVPCGALVDENNKYLIESYRLAYQSTGRDLLRAKPALAGKGTVVFAGPDYDLTVAQRRDKIKGTTVAAAVNKDTIGAWALRDVRGGRWRALKGAAAEAQDVDQALGKTSFGPVRIHAGADALEETFKQVQSPRVLHIATHGFFLPNLPPREREALDALDGGGFGAARGLVRLRQSDNPLLRSGLVMAGANSIGEAQSGANVDDGWLTAAEIAMMDLRGTELVVLSACETGLGKVKTGEGVYGLRRAFLYAGAQTLVTSLFVVPDAQTRDLMRQFYGNLQKGQGKLASLHNAQIEMIRLRRQETGASHPFFWASFVLMGDPD